jgi:hypothetical protein
MSKPSAMTKIPLAQTHLQFLFKSHFTISGCVSFAGMVWNCLRQTSPLFRFLVGSWLTGVLSWLKALTSSDEGMFLLVGAGSHQAICPLRRELQSDACGGWDRIS